MRKGVSEVLIFVSGALVGSAITWFFTKKYYEEKEEKNVRAVEEAFTSRLNEIEDEKDGALDVAKDAILSQNAYQNIDDDRSKEIIKNKSTLEGIIKSKTTDRVDYTEYYSKNSPEAVAVDGVPGEDDELEIDVDLEHDLIDDSAEEECEIPDRPIVEIGNGTPNKNPYLISDEEYGSIPGFDYKEIYFYQSDKTYVDDEEQIIDNPEYLLGDLVESSGFSVNKDRSLFIRNEAVSCDFEVMKVPGTYGN